VSASSLSIDELHKFLFDFWRDVVKEDRRIVSMDVYLCVEQFDQRRKLDEFHEMHLPPHDTLD
jgi:hypothetical protein